MTTLFDSLPPPPLVLPIEVARDLADVSWTLPCQVLKAVREVVDDAALRTEAELEALPRRRGNGAKRTQVEQDYRRMRDTLQQLTRRSCCSGNGRYDGCSVGPVPDFGPAQWRVLAACARGSSATPAELFTVAQAVAPDDEPVDWAAWRAWLRRRHWTFAASIARTKPSDLHEESDRAEEDAQRLLRQAADRQLRAVEAFREAVELEAAAEPHRLALELDDGGLAAYETAIFAGMPPETALQRARHSLI